MNRWYVAQTQFKAELKAQYHLRRQGFDCYLPTFLKRRRHARKVDTVSAPLFPRYIFIHRDLSQEGWRAIHSTIGISHLICQNNLPTPVPIGVVEKFKDNEDDKGNVNMASIMKLAVGEKIQITMGAFVNQIGTFDSLCSDGRVRVLLELLGRPIGVRLPVSAIYACA